MRSCPDTDIDPVSPSYLFCENGDLSFLLYFSRQCLVGKIQRKFIKNSSVIFISEESS